MEKRKKVETEEAPPKIIPFYTLVTNENEPGFIVMEIGVDVNNNKVVSAARRSESDVFAISSKQLIKIIRKDLGL